MLDWILGFFDEDIKLRNNIKKYEKLIDWMRIENKYPLTHKEIFTFRDIYFNADKYLELEEKYHRAKDIKRDDVEFLKSKLGFLKSFYEMKCVLYKYYSMGCGHWKRGYLLFPETCHICNRNFKRFCKDNLYHTKKQNISVASMESCNAVISVTQSSFKYAADYANTSKTRQEGLQKTIKTEQDILSDYENKLANLTPEEIGKRYERYIGYLYETNGYKVEYNGIKMGKKDDGIDIIATKRQELIIIQCKWYKEDSQIHSNTIRQLNDNLSERAADNPNKKVVARLYSAYDNLDEQARARLAKTQIEHVVLPYDNEYSKIKCNINDDNGEKIYHLPGVGMYDYIKINVNRGEFYVKTIEEAEKLGFRGVKKELKAIHGVQQTQAAKEQNEPSEDDAEMEALINGGV
ncbi:restriction endonuclease [uncultured Campylobacter sp.]|uniref:restriction endonuclease n=1 Tax=uncultured Campylobacter sp. TaxID=218934 RepID=UPI002064391F|nr:restriction endonuclease [uncultured Campylobacter sp.]DAJ95827.1 MAG TPA: Restriction endonuclease [Caudoviricetes sp.]